MAKKMRVCKICGKEYEYCGHCPNKNTIEPWRNLYCSENCREAFGLFEAFVTKKQSAVDVKEKLEAMGFTPAKVREVHKPVMNEIFKSGKVIAVSTVESAPSETDKIIDAITPIAEVKLGDPDVVATEVKVEKPKFEPQKNVNIFKNNNKANKPKPKFVNDDK